MGSGVQHRPAAPVLRRPPAIERFRLADRSWPPTTPPRRAVPAQVPAAAAGRRPAGVSRWVNAHGKISLAGFSYAAGATYAGEPVEVVVSERPGGHPARRGRGRHPRTAVPRGPGRPDAAGPGRPPGPGRHRRADRDPAGRRARARSPSPGPPTGRPEWARTFIDVAIVVSRSRQSPPNTKPRERAVGCSVTASRSCGPALPPRRSIFRRSRVDLSAWLTGSRTPDPCRLRAVDSGDNSSVVRCGIAHSVHQIHERPAASSHWLHRSALRDHRGRGRVPWIR